MLGSYRVIHAFFIAISTLLCASGCDTTLRDAAPQGVFIRQDTLLLDSLLASAVHGQLAGRGEEVVQTLAQAIGVGERAMVDLGQDAIGVVDGRLMNALSLLANTYVGVGELDPAIRVAERGVELAERSKAFSRLVSFYVTISRCHSQLGDEETALAWIERAEQYRDSVDADYGAVLDLNAANALRRSGRYGESMARVRHAALSLDKMESKTRTQFYLALMTEFSRTGELDSMEHYIRTIRQLQRDEPVIRRSWRAAIFEGELALRRGDARKALELLVEAEADMPAPVNHELAEATKRSLALALAGLGRMEEAYGKGDEARQVMLDGLQLERVRRLAVKRSEELRAKEQDLNNAELRTRKRSMQLAWSVVVAAVLLAALLAWALRRDRRNAAALTKANRELLSAQAGLAKAERERGAAEVRANIARDVHDDLGAELAKVAMLCEDIKASEDDPVTRNGALAALSDHAGKVTTAVQDIIWATDSSADTVGALVDHVEQTLLNMLKGRPILLRTRFEELDRSRALLPEERRHILLVIKEAVHNAVKHGAPSEIEVDLRVVEDMFSLCVTNDGLVPALGAGSGHGLRNMRERLASLGGSMVVEHRAHGGTVLRADGRFAPTDRHGAL